MSFQKVAIFILSFLLAIFLFSIFPTWGVSFPVLFLVLIISAVFLFFKNIFWYSVIGIVLLGFSLGVLRFSGLSTLEKDTSLHYFAEQKQEITIQGYVYDRPDRKQTKTNFIFQTENIILDVNNNIPVDTKILVQTDPYADYVYGQELIITGKPNIPESFETDQNRVFEYDDYLYKDDIFYTMRYIDITSTGEFAKISWMKQKLYQLKDYFITSINRYIPRPESGLLAGVLFGEKSALDSVTLEQFRIVGLMHIVVLSGYNVAIVIYALMYLLRSVPLAVRSVLAVCGIVAFALLTGAGPTVIRASIMGMFIVLSKLLGEKYDVHKSLLVAGFIMVMINPKILYFDLSFQLSFLATYGLIIFSPWIEKRLKRVPTFLLLRESLVATLAAQVMVLPLILYQIGEFSIISIVVNMLVLFAVPVSMLLGFFVALFGSIQVIAGFFAFPTSIILEYILWIVDIFSRFSFSVITFPKFHWLIMMFAYIIIFIISYRLHHQQKRTGESSS